MPGAGKVRHERRLVSSLEGYPPLIQFLCSSTHWITCLQFLATFVLILGRRPLSVASYTEIGSFIQGFARAALCAGRLC
jgi:hypothetical protein